MFNQDFFPTPHAVIEQMTANLSLSGMTVLEPSAGSGAIVDYLHEHGAAVLACENDPRLAAIVQTKCTLLTPDFLDLKSEQISHVGAIVMNPPFSKGAEHFLHALNIAPGGCQIVCLLNAETLNNTHTQKRKELSSIVEASGYWVSLGNCFAEAERKTGVEVALVTLTKEGHNYATEFEGFFMDEEEEGPGANGLMSYNAVREVVNRYVAAVKLYDKQLDLAAQMNELTQKVFFNGQPPLNMVVSRNSVEIKRDDFKKSMQRAGWNWIIGKMNLEKYATKGLRNDINKFVEEQVKVPFTMRNIYKMLEIIVGTTSQRMEKAILEAFDMVTKHHADNRYNVNGWKTNLHFLVGKKFILPNCVSPAKEYRYTSETYGYLKKDEIADLEKALCYITGKNYDELGSYKGTQWVNHKDGEERPLLGLSMAISRNTYGEWYDCFFFRFKAFKNGNMHFEFRDENVWGLFNQKVAELKGYPLFEAKKQTKYQDRQAGRNKSNMPKILFEI